MVRSTKPYNPTGSLMAPALQRELVAIAAERGMYVLSDEVYRLLEHDLSMTCHIRISSLTD